MLRAHVLERLFSSLWSGRRPRRRLNPSVRPLEDRRLLSTPGAGEPPPTAVMTQTATFPNLESLPTVSSQAILYFSATMGTLTEVDVVTSGSFNSSFYAENLGASSATIDGTTSAHLSINVPTGPIPVTIPSVTQSFNAQPFDGSLDYGGTSGKDFAPITSNAAPQTTVLTTPAELAAFTGNFRIPISVSGHATGNTNPNSTTLSEGFKTQTSATITVIYHFTPKLPSVDPSAGTGSGSGSQPSGSASSGGSATNTGSASSSSGTVVSTLVDSSSTKKHAAKKKKPAHAVPSSHKAHPHVTSAHAHPASSAHVGSSKAHRAHKKK